MVFFPSRIAFACSMRARVSLFTCCDDWVVSTMVNFLFILFSQLLACVATQYVNKDWIDFCTFISDGRCIALTHYDLYTKSAVCFILCMNAWIQINIVQSQQRQQKPTSTEDIEIYFWRAVFWCFCFLLDFVKISVIFTQSVQSTSTV